MSDAPDAVAIVAGETEAAVDLAARQQENLNIQRKSKR